MTTLVAVKFPLGRYHATPWDASVNEGRVEWPPSPWRILRALVSTFKTRLPHLPEDRVTPAVQQASRGTAHISASPTLARRTLAITCPLLNTL